VESIGSLRVFVHAAQARSFRAAGSQLGISSSAIGKAIARLEQQLGVRLFHRSTRSITLTPEGSSFLERCRRILGEIEAAELELAQLHEAPRGTLRVSLPIAGMLMMPAIGAFMRAYPEVRLDLEFTDRLVDVIDEGFDAVIRAGGVTDSRLVGRKLGKFRLRVVAAPDYLARRGIPSTPEALMAHACLHHRFANSGKFERWPLRRRGRDIDVTPPSAAIVNTIEPLIGMAEQGLGIACLPDFAIRGQLESGTLRTVLDEYIEHSGLFHMLWPSGGYTPPKLRAFVDFMAENLFPAATSVTARASRRPHGRAGRHP
jgi:DNA-binding transcriptional LysR family regulator